MTRAQNVQLWILVDIARQVLELRENDRIVKQYSVSTARNGAGERKNSNCTPRGDHVVRAMIGAGQPLGAVFVGRRATGEIYSPALRAAQPRRDWILTRILWLSGTQRGVNRLGEVDTMQRYIYVHGTPDEEPMGVPLSHGCIRMRNADVADLFARVRPGTRVSIVESA